jgi:acetylornithine deacetylase
VTTPIAPGDAALLLSALARVDSRNPSLVPGAPGEGAVARLLADVLSSWGFRVELHDALPGRPNVIARLGIAGAGRSLILNGHLDVVGVDGMTHAPFDAVEHGGRLYGRGSADMKAGVAAMCAAAARAATAGSLPGEVIVTAVVDEEWASAGTRALLERGLRADAAIVTEPTRLAIMPAHRGFAWITVTLHGRAAHGSRYELGVDAIRHAAFLLAELDGFERTVLTTRTHPLLGRASLHASTIEGGTGMSTYPDRCILRLERRTLPSEPPDAPLREVLDACDRVQKKQSDFHADVVQDLAQPPSDVPPSASIVLALAEAIAHEERSASSKGSLGTERSAVLGMSAWTDAALFNEAGIPAICYGPGDIALAHAAEEFVELSEVEMATRVLTQLIRGWCGGSGPWPA